MARNNVQTTVHVGMDVQLAKRNAEALKEVIVTLKNELKQQRAIMESPINMEAYNKASEAVNKLTLQIQTLQKVQRSATPASAYESFISGDVMNSNTLRQATRGAKNRLNTVPVGASDQTSRTFINDINRATMELNRLQAGFSKPLQSVKKELNDLSSNELNRLLQLLKQEQQLVQGNEKAWASYSTAINKVEERMREYDTVARQQMGASTLSKAQSGGFATANERDMQRAIDKLKEYRAVINDPNGSGKATYEATNAEIQKLQANLDVLKQKELEATGQSISRASALQIGMQTLNGTFTGTTQQLNLAKQAIEANMLTVKRGSAEYNAMRQALNGIELELKNVGTLSKEVQAVLDQPKGKSFNALKQAVEQGRLALNAMDRSTEKGQNAFDELAAKIKAADMEMKQLGNSSKGTVSAFDKAWSRLKTYVGLYVGAAVAMQKLSQAMGDLLTLSDKMGEVRKTTGFTADEVGRLSNNLAKLDTRTSLTQLMELSSLAGSVGLKTQEQVQGFTEAANQLIVALPELGNESARTIIKIANATGDLEKNGGNVRETLEKVGSTIIALRANSASAAGPITDFVSRVGAVGAQAGISIDQIAALGSTIDALGGRVEMSATALSRMIPAIKNNSFAIANSIGVTEKYLKSLAPMEQMVLIFQKMRDNIQHIDTTTEQGQEQMAQTIEGMLGKNATMREVMKDLEQQGARAGIVFGLLSQNVDELQKQLGIASEAYRENTALANEFNNMNETTAAKWERLKNQVEEAFVGDSAQRFLGGIIDGLRKIVDLLTGNGGLSTALHTFVVGWGVFKIGLGELFVKILPGYLATLKAALFSTGSLISTYVTGAWAMLKAQIVSTDIATKRMAITWKGLALNRYIIGAWAMLKTHVVQTDIATKRAAISWKAMNASMNANVVLAIVAAIGFLIYKLVEWKNKVSEVAKALAAADTEIFGAQRAVTYLFDSLKKSDAELVNASNAAKKAEESHAALKKEVDELHKSTNLSAEASAYLKQKEDELEESEKKLAEAKSEVVKQESERNKLITEINSKYSTYLGYMLSEDTAARNVADAHALIVAALKEEIYQKKKLGLIDSVTGKHEEKLGEYISASWSELEDLPKEVQSKIMSEWQHFIDGIKYEEDKGFILPNGRVMSSLSNNRQELTNEFQYAIQRATGWDMDKVNKMASNWWGTNSPGQPSWMDDIGFRHWTDESLRMLEEISRTEHLLDTQIGDAHKDLVDATWTAYQGNMRTLADMQQNNKGGDLSSADVNKAAQALVGMTTAITKNAEIRAEAEGGVFANGDVNITITAERFLSGFSKENQTAILAAAQKMQKTSGGTGGGGGRTTPTTSPYGTYNRVTSHYQDWDADALVSRRKEMLERVRALANGADVQAVLSEDAKFISEATRKNIKTTRDAIEWYNTERLKIQDALHEKHLTNTGDWMDPKKGGKKASKMVQDEMKYYLDELDAYYTERKAKIQEAQNDEQISEAEARNRTLANEAEWQQRRGELQQLYSQKRKEVVQEEADAIYSILSDRTSDSTDYIKKDINNTIKFIEKVGTEKGKPAMDRIYGDIDLGMERSFLRQRNAIGQHMKDITAIINKENPYVGITEELRKNLGTMDALLTDIEKDEERTVEKEIERTMFILEQSTKGYSLTWEELMREMAKRGWQAWADAVNGDTQTQERLMHQVYRVFEKVQDAIKKEASEMKKQADIMWSNILLPGGDGKTTIKDAFEQTIGALGIEEGRVSRANSLIGAGQASERVADRLAIQQMKVQIAMRQYQYSLVRKIGREKIESLRKEAREAEAIGDIENARQLRMQAQNAEMALNLATRKEQTEELKQQEAIIAKTEESEARLYKELREWADLLTSSLQSVFEASHAGDAEYYNELAKLNLTGKGGPGAGTYIVIDNEGTSDATAHYEYLDEREALERQHEIERENAQAEAWKKVMDDINMKMSETITDQLNAMLQNASIDANTQATIQNTQAMLGLTGAMGGEGGTLPEIDEDDPSTWPRAMRKRAGLPVDENPHDHTQGVESAADPVSAAQSEIDASNMVTDTLVANKQKQVQTTVQGDKKIANSTQSTFAKMVQAVNLYGVAYQAMQNDNLDMAQKFEMIALQAVGQAAIAGLTAALSEATAKTAVNQTVTASKDTAEHGSIIGPILTAISTAVLGGLMGLAASKIMKSKAQIAQVTGASSVSAGRLSTGMLTYAEGNVNEFTDPATLTPGRRYNVDGADGKTYRARYTGKNPRTHITNGPEFHLVGEAGREAIIDAKTTRLLQMNETGIWQAIQTLYNGGTIGSRRFTRRGMGIRPFADGNLDDFIDSGVAGDSVAGISGISAEQAASLQASIDRQSDLLEDLRINGIKATFDVYGKGGLVDSYDSGKKTLNRYGQRY